MSHRNSQHPEMSAAIGLKDLGTVHRLGFGATTPQVAPVWLLCRSPMYAGLETAR